MERQRLRMPAAGVGVFDLGDFGRAVLTPCEALPRLAAAAGIWIAHLAHAAHQNALRIGAEDQTVDAALIAVRFDDSPACEGWRRETADLLAAGNIPHANFAHQVPGGDELIIRAEGNRLHR